MGTNPGGLATWTIALVSFYLLFFPSICVTSEGGDCDWLSGQRTTHDESWSDVVATLAELLNFLQWKDVLMVDNGNVAHARNKAIRRLNEYTIHVVTVTSVSAFTSFPEFGRLQDQLYFDGHVMLMDSYACTMQLFNTLQERRLFGPKNHWIIATTGAGGSYKIWTTFFAENSKLAVIVNNGLLVLPLRDNSTTQLQMDKVDMTHVWSLQSPGDGSTFFQEVANWSSVHGLRVKDAIFSPVFYDFHNRTLIVSSLGVSPVRRRPTLPGSRWTGFMFEIINILADTLNFRYVVREPARKVYGIKDTNGSWSGLIGDVANRVADIAVADLSWSKERADAVDFTETVFYDSVTFMYKTPNVLPKTWVLFGSYDREVWVGLFCLFWAVVLCVLFIDLANRSLFPSQRSPQPTYLAATESFGNVFRILFNQGYSSMPASHAIRLLLLFWSAVVMVLSSTYSGTLTSSRSTKLTQDPIDSLQGLVKFFPTSKFVVKEGSFAHSFLKDSLVYHEIWEEHIQHNVLASSVTINDIIDLVRHSQYVWITERAVPALAVTHSSKEDSFCEFTISPAILLPSMWALALQKDSSYLEAFNHRIRQMLQMGVIRALEKKYWEEKAKCRFAGVLDEDDLQPIVLSEIATVIGFWLAGQTLAALVLLVELIVERL